MFFESLPSEMIAQFETALPGNGKLVVAMPNCTLDTTTACFEFQQRINFNTGGRYAVEHPDVNARLKKTGKNGNG